MQSLHEAWLLPVGCMYLIINMDIFYALQDTEAYFNLKNKTNLINKTLVFTNISSYTVTNIGRGELVLLALSLAH